MNTISIAIQGGQNEGAALKRFKELTENHTPPDWACNPLRAFYDSLVRLENDRHQHVHAENKVLFLPALAIGGVE